MCPSYLTSSLQSLFSKKTRVCCRKIDEIDLDQFRRDILSSELTLHPSNNLDVLVCQYNHCLSNILDKHAPELTRNIRRKPKQPWNSDLIRDERKKLGYLERKWRKTKSTEDWDAFKAQRNNTNRL